MDTSDHSISTAVLESSQSASLFLSPDLPWPQPFPSQEVPTLAAHLSSASWHSLFLFFSHPQPLYQVILRDLSSKHFQKATTLLDFQSHQGARLHPPVWVATVALPRPLRWSLRSNSCPPTPSCSSQNEPRKVESRSFLLCLNPTHIFHLETQNSPSGCQTGRSRLLLSHPPRLALRWLTVSLCLFRHPVLHSHLQPHGLCKSGHLCCCAHCVSPWEQGQAHTGAQASCSH